MISAFRGDVVQEFFRQVTVRINDAYSMAHGDVLDDEIAEQCGLTRARLTDDVDVLSLVFSGYAKGQRASPHFAFPYDDVRFVVHGCKTSRHSTP
jgi:hypothetical protein